MDKDVEVISRKLVYQGFFKMEKVELRHRLFNGGWTGSFFREIFVRGQAVGAIMYDPDNHLIGLVEQFRVGALSVVAVSNKPQSNVEMPQEKPKKEEDSPWLYEVVAGMAEADESPKDVILRELVEEAGMVPDKLLSICEYFTSPGGTNETLVLFCALGDLRDVKGIHGLPNEYEDIKVIVLPEQDVFNQLYGGRFNNAATLICLQWLLMNKDNLGNDEDAEQEAP